MVLADLATWASLNMSGMTWPARARLVHGLCRAGSCAQPAGPGTSLQVKAGPPACLARQPAYYSAYWVVLGLYSATWVVKKGSCRAGTRAQPCVPGTSRLATGWACLLASWPARHDPGGQVCVSEILKIRASPR